jgi:hypothetical protein
VVGEYGSPNKTKERLMTFVSHFIPILKVISNI